MTQEEKDLLIKDLCARLPYGVEIFYTETIPISTLKTINAEKGDCIIYDHSEWYRHTKVSIEYLKPYLRPISSMTEEEKEELAIIRDRDFQQVRQWLRKESEKETGTPCPITCGEVDYCNKHHIDYRGLIEKGLAIRVTDENNPYK